VDRRRRARLRIPRSSDAAEDERGEPAGSGEGALVFRALEGTETQGSQTKQAGIIADSLEK
jgi:hypothetical protein